MASIKIDFADSLQTRIIDAFCGVYNYEAEIMVDYELKPNPETKGQFTKRKVKEYIKQTVKQYESQTAVDTARNTATQAVENEVVLT